MNQDPLKGLQGVTGIKGHAICIHYQYGLYQAIKGLKGD